jgi:isoleucyl-tRNA synthetase
VDGLKIGIEAAAGDKCERCWIYSEELGTSTDHPGLCPRCASVMAAESK